MIEPLDTAVLGVLADEPVLTAYIRNGRLLQELPDNVRLVVLWGSWYVDGDHPRIVEGVPKYTWKSKAAARVLCTRIRQSGRKALAYIHSGGFGSVLGSMPAMDAILAHLEEARSDGVYFDGVPPLGVANDTSADWLALFRERWLEANGVQPVIILHASGYRMPGDWAAQADVVLAGEHGAGSGIPWSDGEWPRLDSLAHWQWNAWTGAVIRLGSQSASMMPTKWRMGTDPDYPEGWPPQTEWYRHGSYYGPLIVWVFHSGMIEPLRNAVAYRDIGRMMEPAP